MARRNGDQWGWNDMEELLQCPVCLDVPVINSMVEQCRNGHHICATCRVQVSECPICKCNFYGTRNFVVEELCSNYEILKNLLLLTALEETESQKTSKPKREPKSVKPKVPTKVKLDTPKSSRGSYPCRANGCEKLFPSCRLLNHVRSAHGGVIEDIIGDNGVFSKDFEIVYPVKDFIKQTDFIFSIRGIGLVFLNIEVLQSGDLVAFLRMGAPWTLATKYIGCLQLKNPLNNVAYEHKQQLISVRESVLGMFQKKLAFALDKTSCKRVCTSGKIQCTLTIKLYSELRDRLSLNTVDPYILNITAALRASLIEQKLKQKAIKISTKTSTTNNNNGAIRKTTSNIPNAPTLVICEEVPQQSTTSTGASGSQNNKSKSRKQKRRRR